MGVCAFGGDKTSLSCLPKSISLRLESTQALFNATSVLGSFAALNNLVDDALKCKVDFKALIFQ